jgi:hypothetical protein
MNYIENKILDFVEKNRFKINISLAPTYIKIEPYENIGYIIIHFNKFLIKDGLITFSEITSQYDYVKLFFKLNDISRFKVYGKGSEVFGQMVIEQRDQLINLILDDG